MPTEPIPVPVTDPAPVPVPGAGFRPAEELLITSPEQLKVVSDPLRLSIMELIVSEALTVKQMAGRLSQPATKLYYHVAELEGAGFVTMVDTRVKSGIIEKYYRTTSTSIRVDRRLLDVSGAQDGAFSSLVAVTFDTTIQELAHSVASGVLNISADPATTPANFVLGRTLVRFHREDAPRFIARFRELLAEIDAVNVLDDADGVDYACLLAFYPRPIRQPNDSECDVK